MITRRLFMKCMGGALAMVASWEAVRVDAAVKRFLPIVAGPQILKTFTDANLAAFFYGYFDTTTNANARTWDKDLSIFTGYVHGSTAVWTATSNGAQFKPLWVSIDGGPEFNPTLSAKSNGLFTLYRNLSDGPHRVHIRADASYGTNNARTPTNVTLLSVVGVNPRVTTGPDLGTWWHVADTSGGTPLVDTRLLTPTVGGNFTPTYKIPGLPAAVTRCIGSAESGVSVFAAKCSSISVLTGESFVRVAIDGVAQPIVPLSTTALFTGTLNGAGVLTVTALTQGAIQVGAPIWGPGVVDSVTGTPTPTVISSQLTSTAPGGALGGAGTYAVNGTQTIGPIAMVSSSGVRMWKKIPIALDQTTSHTYWVATAWNRFAEANPSSTLGIMIGDAGATFQSAPIVKRTIELGDSITESAKADGYLNLGGAGVPPLQYTQNNDGLIGAMSKSASMCSMGTSGLTTANLVLDMDAIIAGLSGTIDVAVMRMGRNDGTGGAPFPANYKSCIDKLVAQWPSIKVLCRGSMEGDAAGPSSLAIDTAIAGVVTTEASANVVYIPTNYTSPSGTWGAAGIQTNENYPGTNTPYLTHPTDAGYATVDTFERPVIAAVYF